ncbi:MAG: hypothetical protein U5R49_08730 [Deltaproteobacteria bacterium]|nr:hypothetical protein [Deltaproteobacteria bacterium]
MSISDAVSDSVLFTMQDVPHIPMAFVFGEEPAAGVVKRLFEQEVNTKLAIHMSWINQA